MVSLHAQYTGVARIRDQKTLQQKICIKAGSLETYKIYNMLPL